MLLSGIGTACTLCPAAACGQAEAAGTAVKALNGVYRPRGLARFVEGRLTSDCSLQAAS